MPDVPNFQGGKGLGDQRLLGQRSDERDETAVRVWFVQVPLAAAGQPRPEDQSHALRFLQHK